MDIKKFKHDVKIENLEIPELSKDVINYSKRTTKIKEAKERIDFSKLFRKSLMFAPLVIMLLVVVISMVGSTYSYDCKIQTIKNKSELERVLNFERKSFDFDFNFGVDKEGSNAAPGAPGMDEGANEEAPGGSGGSEGDYSQTNTQEEGVDEADIIKTDGKKIYYLSEYQKHLMTYDINTEEVKLVYLGNMFNGTIYELDMYLTDKYVVMTSYYSVYIENDKPQYSGYKIEENIAIQLYDKDNLELVKEYKNTGKKIDSRKVGNYLYYVYTQVNVEDLPCDIIDGQKNEYKYSDIYYSQSTVNEGYTYIVSMNLDTLDINAKIQLGANNWTTVYATEKSIYLAVTNTTYRLDRYSINGIPEEIGTVSDSCNVTTIFRYELDGININYKGVLISKGAVNDQFYLDEFDDHLRVVLQLGNNNNGNNKLEIYDLKQVNSDGKIEKVASIDNGIGKPYENIKSVRFNDNSCLIVTYVQTDPLYYIDLTNQLEPKIIGEYEEPGYNTYLHYLTDTLAIGFGYSDDWYFKMGLYVIEDGTPNKVDEIMDYAYLAPTQNHKALYIEDMIFGFSCAKAVMVDNGTYVGYDYKYCYEMYTIDTTGEEPKFKLLYTTDENYSRVVRIADKYYFVGDFGFKVVTKNFEEGNNISWFEKN